MDKNRDLSLFEMQEACQSPSRWTPILFRSRIKKKKTRENDRKREKVRPSLPAILEKKTENMWESHGLDEEERS